MSKMRCTIGFLFDYVYDDYIKKNFRNILKCCRYYDLNFIGFSAGSLGNPDAYRQQRNYLYELVSKNNVDGIIALSASICNYVDASQGEKLFMKFDDIPIVNIGMKIGNHPTILIDNISGMKNLIEHIITKHGCKKIAFIKGPQNVFDAESRFYAYKETLKEYDIPLVEKLIVNGTFDHNFGIKAVSILLDERKADFDAIVSSNDSMAISAIRELKKRGIRIPEDVIVTGFDDAKESLIVNPQLSTVRQPFYELARKSIKTLLKLLDGKKCPDKIFLPTELVLRQSCGCKIEDRIRDEIFNITNSTDLHIKSNPKINKKNINDIYFEIRNKLPQIKENNIFKNIIHKLIINLYNELNSNNYSFLSKLKDSITLTSYLDLNVIFWYKVADLIFYYYYIYFYKEENYDAFNNLQKETYILIGTLNEQYKSSEVLKIENDLNVIFRLNEDFIQNYDLNKIKDIIKVELQNIGLNSCYICLYDYNKQKNLKYSKLFFYFNNDNKILSTKSFLSKNLLPGNIKSKTRFEYTIMPLYFKVELLGYIIFEIGTLNGAIYEMLSSNFAGVIHGAYLSNKIKEYTNELELKVKERTSELEEVNKKLKDLDSLKNDFIANITHDFRSPLMVILSLADLAIKTSDNPDDNYSIIYEASLKLKKTVDRLLDLAKMDAVGINLKIKKINLIKNLSLIVNFYNSSLSKTNIKIYKNFPKKEINNLYTDEEKLEEVVNNILSNAIKFVNPLTGKIKISVEDHKRTILISISDNGIGMPKDKLKIIFDRFEQIKSGRNSKYRGTGIGLAYSKQLFDFMKGEIWAESEGPDKGSIFYLELLKGKKHFDSKYFKMEKKESLTRKITRKEIQYEIDNIFEKEVMTAFFNNLNKENEYDYKKGKILIIDDDKQIRQIIMDYLVSFEYENFILASNGVLGLDAIYKYHPDLIICDYNMAPIKGDVVHDEIALNPGFNKIPFVFISAVDDRDIIYDRRKKGASSYLTKPVDENELRVTVDNLLKKHIEYLKTYHLASIDELSGLLNKRTLLDRLNHLLAERIYRHISVIFFDIDYFKEFNDTYGHQFGDEIIVQVGKTLKSILRNYDIAGRYGGDEFVIILPNTNIIQTNNVAVQIQKDLFNNKIIHENENLSIYVSIGISSLIDGEKFIINSLNVDNLKSLFEVDKPEETNWDVIDKYKNVIAKLLIKMADIALYKAKSTICKSCGYSSEKSVFCKMDACPKCGGTYLIKGRNKIVKFE